MIIHYTCPQTTTRFPRPGSSNRTTHFSMDAHLALIHLLIHAWNFTSTTVTKISMHLAQHWCICPTSPMRASRIQTCCSIGFQGIFLASYAVRVLSSRIKDQFRRICLILIRLYRCRGSHCQYAQRTHSYRTSCTPVLAWHCSSHRFVSAGPPSNRQTTLPGTWRTDRCRGIARRCQACTVYR